MFIENKLKFKVKIFSFKKIHREEIVQQKSYAFLNVCAIVTELHTNVANVIYKHM